VGFILILRLFNVLNKEEYEFLEFFTVEDLTGISLEFVHYTTKIFTLFSSLKFQQVMIS
jgi:hypothetical protein